MSDEQPATDEEPDEGKFRDIGEWKTQANKVEKPNPLWDMPDE